MALEAQVPEELVMVIVFALMIFAGVAVLWIAMSNRRALRAMEHQERLAMIHAGVVPAPEADPLAFETHLQSASAPAMSRQDRWRTAGTLTMGLGLAMLVLLTFTGATDVGIGIGGAFAVLGAAFLVNGLLLSPSAQGSRPMVRPTSSANRPPDDAPSSSPF
jgi:hypothetical protein